MTTGLFLHRWDPVGPPTAVVWIVHGIGEHGGRYADAAKCLTDAGLAVRAYDQRGHGRSPGPRGHITHWSDYREDLRSMLSTDFTGGLPLFLYGHSMGALVVLDYLLHHPEGVRGAVLSSPAIAPAAAERPFLVAAAKFFSLIWPSKCLPLNLDLDSLSRDPSVRRNFEADPLVHAQTTARWGAESVKVIRHLWARRGDLRTPLFFIQGLDDQINDPEGTRRFVQGFQSGVATLREWPGVRHEPQHDPETAIILGEISTWINTLEK